MILDKIFSKTKEDLKQRKLQFPIKNLKINYIPKDVCSALKKERGKIKIIAEVKKASPSKGEIRKNFSPLEIAKNYEINGASAISVLTEPHFFKGKLQYLKTIREQVTLPLLRKDFIFDEYQILETLFYGGDFVLLIAKMLDEKTLKKLFEFARNVGLEVLFEIHSLEDLQKANFCGANIIGINHRNLDDFTMNMNLCEELLDFIPKNKIIVCESGLYKAETLKKLSQIGVDAFLIGEHFMRQDDEGQALKNIMQGSL